MAAESNVWTDVRALLERIKEEVRSSRPSGEISVAPADGLILNMYQRCVSLFRSVLILLDDNQPEEALILARSLFVESLRLMELEDAGTERAVLTLGHYRESLKRIEGLFGHNAKRLGLTDDISDVLAGVEKQRGDIESYRKRHRIGKLRNFRAVDDAAVKLNREKDLWIYLLSHGMVHGGETSHLYRRENVEADVMAFYSYTSDPDLLAEVGVFAARSISHAVYAVASIFDWGVSPELKELIAELERRESATD
jgi:hypothetical protein